MGKSNLHKEWAKWKLNMKEYRKGTQDYPNIPFKLEKYFNRLNEKQEPKELANFKDKKRKL